VCSVCSPLAPKYQVERGCWNDQKPARDNTSHDPVKSAKPPSPVQIRAAPANFQCEVDRLCVSRTSGRVQLDYGGLEVRRRTRERALQTADS
jgi:hypothetical protein